MRFIKGHKTNVGRKCSEETKNKISLAQKGKPRKYCFFTKGHKINLGKKYSEERRRNISTSLKGRHLSESHKESLSKVFKIVAKEKGFGKWMKGKKHKPETIKKMIEARKGFKHSEETKQKISMAKMGHLGRKLTVEQRRKQSIAMKSYWGPRIDKTHNELYERVRNSLEQRLWREAVFKRDNYTCQKCGDDTGGNLEADHVEAFIAIIRRNKIKTMAEAIKCDELWNVNNGRTLCKKCHYLTENWGAKARMFR